MEKTPVNTETLDSVIREILLCKVSNFDREEWLNWMFEYACQRLEYEGLHPATNTPLLQFYMLCKLKVFKDQILEKYNPKTTARIEVKLPPYGAIPFIIRREYGEKI